MYSSLQKIFTPYNGSWLYDQHVKSHPLNLHNYFQIANLKTQSSCDQEDQSGIGGSSEMQEEKPSNDIAIKNLNIVLAINEKYLFLLEDKKDEGYKPTHYTSLDFDLKFEVLRKNWVDQLTPGQAYGVRIERGNGTFRIQFLNQSSQIVQMWRRNLQKKINQRNFHQLFKAKKKIGKGAFATVYLAERLIDNKMVAVKAFSKEKQFSTKNGKEALINEIKLMRTVDHPNVIRLESIYETENSIYMTLEILEGGQLHERLKVEKNFSQQNVKKIIEQLLKALSHLSQKRIIHRDLKTENIMFRKKGSFDLVLCDFGLATFADQEEYLFVRCGTPGFVAPEIINIKNMNTKSEPISDVFSAGIIFHYLLMGHSVFPGRKYNEVLVQNRSCDFNFNQEEYRKIDKDALDLMRNMLIVDPSKRPSAEQCLKHSYFGGQMQVEQPVPNTNTMMEQEGDLFSVPQYKKQSSMTSDTKNDEILKANKLFKRSSQNSDFYSLMKKEDYSKPQTATKNPKLKLVYNDSSFVASNKENIPPSQIKVKESQKILNLNVSTNRSFGGSVYQNLKSFNEEA